MARRDVPEPDAQPLGPDDDLICTCIQDVPLGLVEATPTMLTRRVTSPDDAQLVYAPPHPTAPEIFMPDRSTTSSASAEAQLIAEATCLLHQQDTITQRLAALSTHLLRERFGLHAGDRYTLMAPPYHRGFRGSVTGSVSLDNGTLRATGHVDNGFTCISVNEEALRHADDHERV